jgi:hypothetical protein
VDDITSTSDLVATLEPDEIRFTPEYVKRLLVERMYIYAKLHNPGGSVILRNTDVVDHDRPLGYSTQIGNSFHLDLIELEKELQDAVDEGTITRSEVEAMLTWADGMTSQQAAYYLHETGSSNIRKLRERGKKKLQERLDGKG